MNRLSRDELLGLVTVLWMLMASGCGHQRPGATQAALVESWGNMDDDVDALLERKVPVERHFVTKALGPPDFCVQADQLEQVMPDPELRNRLLESIVVNVEAHSKQIDLAPERVSAYVSRCRLLVYDEGSRFRKPHSPRERRPWWCPPDLISVFLWTWWGPGFEVTCFALDDKDLVVGTGYLPCGDTPAFKQPRGHWGR